MAHDLRTTLSPVYGDVLTRLLKLLPRNISAPALTALLSTFSSLFKYLLVPSIHIGLLEQTWTLLRAILPKCLLDVQRAMAEVWGSVLRRMKMAAREKAVTMVAASAEGIEDASAWVFVFACKVIYPPRAMFISSLSFLLVCLSDATYRNKLRNRAFTNLPPLVRDTRGDGRPHPPCINSLSPSRQDRKPVQCTWRPPGRGIRVHGQSH